MQSGILEQILILLAASLPLSLILRRLGQSTVVGYLLTGVLIGPGGLGLIADEAAIGKLADIGVALLLFAVGIELSFAQLARSRRVALVGGTLQVLFVAAAAGGLFWAFTGRLIESAYVGGAIAQSSSTVLLKMLGDRGELDAPYAMGTVAMSIVQDLGTIPMLVILPALGSAAGADVAALAGTIGVAGGQAALVLGGMWLSARFVIAPALHLVARARSPEVFVVTVVALVLAAAWAAGLVGLSVAIGAFCAGILLSESEYAHQILADVLPFRDVFQAVFFVSIGMLLDSRFVAHNAPVVLGLVAAVIAGKSFLSGLAAWLGGAPARIAAASGVALAPIGEFAFVVLTVGRRTESVSTDVYQLTLAASIVSMAAAPPIIASMSAILGALARLPLVGAAFAGRPERRLGDAAAEKRDHVVIVGFGPVGRDVAQFLADHRIDFVAIELNPGTIRRYRERGIDIFYGDASNPHVLREAGLARARALAITIPDPASAKRAVLAARALAPEIPIVVRTKYRGDADAFAGSGADEVVEEEFETAREMVVRLASGLEIPRRLAVERMAGPRLERYRVGPRAERLRVEGAPFPPFDVELIRVDPKGPIAGKTIAEADLRRQTGATVIAITHEERTAMNPPPGTVIGPYDKIACLGTPEELAAVRRLAGAADPLSASGKIRALGASGKIPSPRASGKLRRVERPCGREERLDEERRARGRDG